jgi:hypothetical protein
MRKSETEYKIGDKVRVNTSYDEPRMHGKVGVIEDIKRGGLFKTTILYTIYFGEYPLAPGEVGTRRFTVSSVFFDKISAN